MIGQAESVGAGTTFGKQCFTAATAANELDQVKEENRALKHEVKSLRD